MKYFTNDFLLFIKFYMELESGYTDSIRMHDKYGWGQELGHYTFENRTNFVL